MCVELVSKRGDECDQMKVIIDVDDRVVRVDVAGGNSKDNAGYATVGLVEGSGIGATAAADGDLVRDVGEFRGLDGADRHHFPGRLRTIAFTGAKRWEGMPDLPTVSESGIPGMVFEASWHGLFAPAGTSPQIVSRLQSEYGKVVSTPKMRDNLGGHVPVASTSPEFRKFLREYFRDTAEQMRIANVKPE